MKVRALVTRTFNDVMAFSYDVLHGRATVPPHARKLASRPVAVA